MQTDIFDQLDDLSPKERQKLSEQIRRVQSGARNLRSQANQLRSMQKARKMSKKSQKAFQRGNQSLVERGQGLVKRGKGLASSGTSAVKTQLENGRQLARERGGTFVQVLSQHSDDLTDDWTDGTPGNLRKQGLLLTLNASDWTDETAHRLRKQRRSLASTIVDLTEELLYKLRRQSRSVVYNLNNYKEDTAHKLRRQSRAVANNLNDYKDDTTHKLRRQSRAVAHNLNDYKDDAAHKLRRQSRTVTRNIVDRKEDTAHALRKQSRSVSRNLTKGRGGVAQALRDQSQQLVDQSSQFLERQRKSRAWPIIGFVSGLLLASGITFWVVKFLVERSEAVEEGQVELPQHEHMNGVLAHAGEDIRYSNQGGTAVATHPHTASSRRKNPAVGRTDARREAINRSEKNNEFVGVLSTRQYYPIERKPDVHDLIFFGSEEEARAEGFTAAR